MAQKSFNKSKNIQIYALLNRISKTIRVRRLQLEESVLLFCETKGVDNKIFIDLLILKIQAFF